MAEVWPGRWCRGDTGSAPAAPVSMAEVWPGRWCPEQSRGRAAATMFQWPKYGRVDGAGTASPDGPAAITFQWPKYGRVDGAGRAAGMAAKQSFNGRSMAGSMVPSEGRMGSRDRLVSMAEVWPGRWCNQRGGRKCLRLSFQWPKYGRVDGAQAENQQLKEAAACFNGRSMAGSMVP